MITQEYLLELFEYSDGHLIWKKKTSTLSRAKIGEKAGYFDKGCNYYRLKINNKSYLVHRIIYMMHYGNLPDEIDHIDGNTSNNRIENLRTATHSQNLCNQKMPSHNTSGIKGVSWKKPLKKWFVQLKINNKKRHFGYFDDIELAELVSIEARNKYHKEFANHG